MNKTYINRRDVLKIAGIAAGSISLFGHEAIAAKNVAVESASCRARKKIKIAYIGGGSQIWAPNIIRDIVCKPQLKNVEIEIALIDIHMGRAQAIHELFKVKLKEWSFDDRVRIYPTLDPVEGLTNADFVIITISTGRLPAMSYDLDTPEKYSIYHTVGDTCGPGGWARGLRNFPVFEAYARQIKKLAPNAYVLNYSNPLAALTKVLANELGQERVVGLCHGLFECYDIFMKLFKLEKEEQIRLRFGGVNHFFWILDIKIDGQDAYKLLTEKLKDRQSEEFKAAQGDPLGFVSRKLVTMELFENYRIMPYIGDRHTSEFFGCYITNKQTMEKFKLVRTTIADREKMYADAAENIRKWTEGAGGLTNRPSRETAADIITAIIYNEPYADVVNLVNQGQISNLPFGAVVETLGQVGSQGFTPFTVGPLPDKVKAVVQPHAEVQLRTVNAYLSGDVNETLMALAADPVCSHLTISESKKMGIELLEAHKKFLPNFYKA
jgi:alpha-galactosidase/6-phospho-beta-glucosidase family protein